MKFMLKNIIHALKFIQRKFECFISNLKRVEHFEVCILKLIYKLVDQLNSNFILILSLWFRIHIRKIIKL